MPVAFVVNGYFRSGTTLVWRILRDSNPDLVCLYEPCHVNLGAFLDGRRGAEELHGTDPWTDYERLAPATRDHMRAARRGLPHRYPQDIDELSAYADTLHAEARPLLTQVNRWHFVLGPLAERCGCRLAHIIRRPGPIFQSMRHAYRRQGSWWARCLKRTGAPDHRAFNLRGYFRGLSAQASPPDGTAVSDFEAFMATWLLANVAACEAVRAADGLLFSYEGLRRDPGAVTAGFEGLGLRFDTAPLLRRDADEPDLAADLPAHRNLWQRLGLADHGARLEGLVAQL